MMPWPAAVRPGAPPPFECTYECRGQKRPRPAPGPVPSRKQSLWIATLTVVLIAATPALASAQHEDFVSGLVDFTVALVGTYGDEGEAARAALDRAARGLAEWDRTLAEYEGNVAAALPTATPDRAREMHTTMGSLYVARGRLDDALREFEAAVRAAPAQPLLHLFRGLVHDRAGRPAEALKAFGTAADLDAGNPTIAYMLAARAGASGEPHPDAALATLAGTVRAIVAREFFWKPAPFLDTALLADNVVETPLFVPALYRPAFELFDRGSYAEAVHALRAATMQDPLFNEMPAPMREGAAALREGRVADAVAHFTAATREAPGSEAHRMLGMAFWLAAEYDSSVEHLEEAIRLAPADERARVMLARILEEIGEGERAERLLEETVEALPFSSLARWRLGQRYAVANRTADALQQIEQATGAGLLAGEEPLHLEIGALHRRDVETERAAAAFRRAIALRPNDGVAHRELGRALLQLGDADAASVELAAALIVDPADYEACVTLGQIHMDAGRHAEAARILAYAVELAPDHAEARYALASSLIRSGRRDEASPHMEAFAQLQAAAIEDQRRRIDLSVLKLEASVRNEQRDFTRAAALWSELVAAEPDAAANHAGLGTARAGEGLLEEAVAHYERALTLGASPDVYQQLARLYEDMGRPDDSARTWARLARAQQEALDAPAPAR